MAKDKFRYQNIILEMIRRRADTMLGREIVTTEDYKQYIVCWNKVCEEVKTEFLQDGLESSAKEAARWSS